VSFSSPAGWYPDPEGSGRQRFWDGQKWTDAVAAAVPAGPPPDVTRTWSMAAHWSAVPFGLVVLTFLGPLIVLRGRGRNDLYVREHAVEALNFNLSVLLYWLAGGTIALIGGGLHAGAAVVAAITVAWLVLVVRGWIRASHGELYRYPLAIRFVAQ
jgi:uncharacterized Tic20 family protein